MVHRLRDRIAALSRAEWRDTLRLRLRDHRRFTAIALVALIPAVYVAYCVVTIPFAADLSAQSSPGALVMQSDDGRAVAMRGVLK
jgi:hypothetical protein